MASNILPVLDQAKIARADVRLWSAHYGFGEHICGPSSCGLVPIEMDGTQWTNTALGRNLDQSSLLENFFTTSPLSTEAELQSGNLNLGSNAQTVVSVAQGTAHRVAFGCDNGLMALPPARLRVAIYGGGWRVFENVVVDGTKGQTIIAFPSPAQTGVLSINRMDAGNAQVGWVVY